MRISLKNRLTFNFIIALSLIAIISITSYFLTRQSLQAKISDAGLINISGQQSTLSQRIVKSTLLIKNDLDPEARTNHQKALNEWLNLWQTFHKGLRDGDPNLGLPGNNPPPVQALFDEINPHYQKIRKYANKFTEINPRSQDEVIQREMSIWLDSIRNNEDHYLELMQQVTHTLSAEVDQKLNNTQQIETYLLIGLLVILLIEWLVIFRPTRQLTLRYVDRLHENQEELEALYANLKTSQAEVQQRNEDLKLSQKEISQNMIQLESTNRNLHKSTEELKQKNEILREATELLDLKNKQIRKQRDKLLDQSQQLELKNRNITNSIRYAKRIQDAIVPHAEEVTQHFGDAMVFFKPRDIVSGDFYWITKKDKDIILMAADCTGHGVPGALMTMIGNSLINEIVNNKNIYHPSEILHELDLQIVDMLQRRSGDKPIHDGMDMAILNINLEKCYLEYSAAHNPLYYVKNGEMNRVRGSKFPVGSAQYKTEKVFELHQIQGEPGDVFYIFSDGFQDQYNAEIGRKYMSKRFRNFLLMISHLPMAEQHAKLEVEFNNWKGEGHQTDDVLIIGFRF